jgi:glycosyltransferase involved in cell wall biosynthesis
MVGGGPLRRHERKYLIKLGVEHKVKTIKANDSNLAWLYQHCAATLIPSLSEGFSLPLIESLACNAPILASDLPVHREVGSGYATLLSPHSPNHWRDALVAALEGQIPKPSEKLTPKDLEDLRNHFSIARMARDHASLYGTINRR